MCWGMSNVKGSGAVQEQEDEVSDLEYFGIAQGFPVASLFVRRNPDSRLLRGCADFGAQIQELYWELDMEPPPPNVPPPNLEPY